METGQASEMLFSFRRNS